MILFIASEMLLNWPATDFAGSPNAARLSAMPLPDAASVSKPDLSFPPAIAVPALSIALLTSADIAVNVLCDPADTLLKSRLHTRSQVVTHLPTRTLGVGAGVIQRNPSPCR